VWFGTFRAGDSAPDAGPCRLRHVVRKHWEANCWLLRGKPNLWI